MRQHVNPLSRFFQFSFDIPSPEELFNDPNLPIHLDIGCARGRFLTDIATVENQWNFLGIDIRRPLVDAAERERKQLELRNLRFFFCNANVSLENWFMKLSKNQLQRVSIQFPDPWFKKRHQKRRVLNQTLLISLANALYPGGELFLQSDVISVIKPMIDLIQLSQCFDVSQNASDIWLNQNPFQFPTERERYVMNKGIKVYRALFYRNKNNLSNETIHNLIETS